MDIISVFREVVTDPSMSWVLFKNGTCVMLLKPEKDITMQAMNILKDHGSVVPGTPSGDFEVTRIPDIQGWIVTGFYPGIMTYVSEEEVGRKNSDLEIGILGRTKRVLDAANSNVIHVESKLAKYAS